MKRTSILHLAGAGLITTLLLVLIGINSTKDSNYTGYNPSFDAYLSAFTSGEISRKSTIQVRFASSFYAEEAETEELETSPFRFSPNIAGKARWKNSRTLEFIPNEHLPSGELYQASLDMKQLIPQIPDSLSNFRFQFASRHQGVDVAVTEVRSLGGKNARFQQLKGVVRTVDFEPALKVEKLVQARIPDRKLRIRWEHQENANLHTFTIDSLERGEKSYAVKMSWDGSEVGIEAEGETEVVVPEMDNFRLMHTYSYGEPEQYVVLEFSDPLKKSQDLTGLIRMGKRDIRYSIDGNRIKVFPTSRVAGSAEIQIEPGLESVSGKKSVLPSKKTVVFSEIKPEVKLIGKGVIIPRSKTLPFIFEAIGLRSIDVRVIKIYEKNIPQFLQVNQLEGSRELKRVGQQVVKKRIDLDKNSELDLNQWNRHSLDLASLINPDPGAIYEVAIGFRKSYSFYNCSEEGSDEAENDMLALDASWINGAAQAQSSYWDNYYYNYEDQSDPCKKA